MERSLTDAGLQAGIPAGRNLAEASPSLVSGLDLSGLLRTRFQGELATFSECPLFAVDFADGDLAGHLPQ